MMTDLKDTLKVGRPSESQHWYTKEGQPVYTVKVKNGNGRATTLRDARKLGLVPSVTTIIKAAAKPALENWKQNQVLLAALTLPKEDGETDDQWCKRIMEDSRQHAIQAAAKGIEIHAAIQGACEGFADPEYSAYIAGVESALHEWHPGIPGNEWVSEMAFAHPLGFGGKADLSAGVINIGRFVADYKTKGFGPDDDLKVFDEQAMQLAAYREGLGLKGARCAIVYISITNPGVTQLVEFEEWELQRGWDMFRHLLAYWKYQKKYESGWEAK